MVIACAHARLYRNLLDKRNSCDLIYGILVCRFILLNIVVVQKVQHIIEYAGHIEACTLNTNQ